MYDSIVNPSISSQQPLRMDPKLRPTGVLEPNEYEHYSDERISGAIKKKDEDRKFEFVWRSAIIIGTLHLGALYGLWLMVSGQTKLVTVIFGKNFHLLASYY